MSMGAFSSALMVALLSCVFVLAVSPHELCGVYVQPSKYAQDLPVVENPPKISPSNWKCADCGASTNLWLNLSDG